jgi:uncharacterized membrane protein YphA (DoxX/SURF4 family)
MTVMLRHPVVSLMLRLYLGGLFVYASLNKINFPAEFSDHIAAYLIVPHWLVNPMAVFLPWIEFVSGICLITGIRVRACAAVISTLMVIFTVALIVVIIRETPIDCGCFKNVGDPVTWTTVIRDLVWLAMGIHVYLFDRLVHLDRLFMIRPEDLEQP